jgi:hypothetical protein
MTSLFMGAVNYAGVPADEKTVRATAVPYYADKPAAEMPDQPEMSEVRTDGDPNLGLTNRSLASAWHEGNRADAASWAGQVADVTSSFSSINQQVSTSGLAASRELAGETHKNLSYAVGIEPVNGLTDGGRLTNTYFRRDERAPMATADLSMMSVPPGYDHKSAGQAAQVGKDRARNASVDALYNTFWNGGN